MTSFEKPAAQPSVKYDNVGLPLVPQPTASPLDPLNYPMWLKLCTLAQIALIAFITALNTTIINPAVVLISKEFRIEPVVATYQTAVLIGVVYGRRPVYLVSLIIGTVSAVGSAIAKSYGTLIVARAIYGFGTAVAIGLGAGTVVDLFYVHQRGKAMGLFTLMFTNGGHISPIIGGYVAKSMGWRWCFWVGAFLNGVMFIICLVFLPETIFERDNGKKINETNSMECEKGTGNESTLPIVPYIPPKMTFATYLETLRFWTRSSSRRIAARDFFIKPLSMFQYRTVTFPAIYYGVTYAYASVEAGLTVATLFTRIYKFDTVRDGLANGISLLVGATLGEMCTGPVTDLMMQRARKKALVANTVAPPEFACLGFIQVPSLFLLVFLYGFTIHYTTNFIPPCIGMVQTISSVTYTYSCSDCHQSRSYDVSICFHVFRQLFAFPLGFYSIPLGDKIGFQWSFTIYAIICVICFLPIVTLILKGERWSKNVGKSHSDVPSERISS
ncbi:major facilitator superfamily domain-containing protein [Cyathus striatus]|nr:major facilitator superfamily domain-containing protein [Cyathus striatus]